MRYFCTLFCLQLKSTLRSAVFLISAAFFLLLTLTLGAVLPQEQPAGLRVGIAASGTVAEQAAGILENNEDYQLLRYTDAEALRRDVLRGGLHCGYLLADAKKDGPPITVLETDGSYLRPLLDQLVFSAYFEASVQPLTALYLQELGYGSQHLPELFTRLERSAKPMEIRLEAHGEFSGFTTSEKSDLTPMLYAVMVVVFVGLSLLQILLNAGGRQRAFVLLSRVGKRRFETAAAPVAATVLLQFALLLGCDLLLGGLLGAQGYPLAGRLTAFLLLACFTALLTLAAAPLRRWAGAVCAVLPVWLLASVLCSGALVDPATLPAGLSLLRFLSPAWYALRVLGAF